MTLPNEAAGLSPNIDSAFPITAESADPDQSVSMRGGLSQSYVEARLKQERVNNSPGWGRARNAIGAQAQTIMGTTAEMLQLMAGLGVGSPSADDFERYDSNDLGPNWDIYHTGSGSIKILDKHNAAWDGLTDASFLARRNDGMAVTNNQTTTIVLGSSPTIGGIPASHWGYNDLWLRMRGDFTTYNTRTGIRARYGANSSVKITWVNSGVETELASVTVAYRPTNGAVLDFRAGVGSNVYRYVARLNGEVIIDYIDGDMVTQFGPDYMHRGFGGRQEIGFLTSGKPGKVSQWTGQG